MMNPISGLPIQTSPGLLPAVGGEKAQTPEFNQYLLSALEQVNTMQGDADAAVEQLLTGGDVNPAEVLTAVQKADMSFRMVMQIRNKLVQAYQEIQNIRI